MTESEWLECTDPKRMLELLPRKATDRKLWLLSVAGSRRIGRLLPLSCRVFNDVLERYADGLTTTSEYQDAWTHVEAEYLATNLGSPDTRTYAIACVGISNPPTVPSVLSCLEIAAKAVACAVADDAPEAADETKYDPAHSREAFEQIRLLRDVFGHSFRAIRIDSSWLTPTVIGLASSAYDERSIHSCQLDPACLAVLSDALEEAGCDDADILNHLRSPGPHVRGCWVVDLLLGKE